MWGHKNPKIQILTIPNMLKGSKPILPHTRIEAVMTTNVSDPSLPSYDEPDSATLAILSDCLLLSRLAFSNEVLFGDHSHRFVALFS